MASYELRRIQDTIIVISDNDPTEVSLTPINGTETDYFIRPADDHVWKRVGNDVDGYEYTDLGAIGGGGGGGITEIFTDETITGEGTELDPLHGVVEPLWQTLQAGNVSGGFDIIMTGGDKIKNAAGIPQSLLIEANSDGGMAIYTTAVGANLRLSSQQILITDSTSATLLNLTTANGIKLQQGISTTTITGQNSNLTLSKIHHTVMVDASAGAVDITLPAAASHEGREYYIGALNIANTARVLGIAAGNHTFSAANQFIKVKSNGVNWYIISKYL